MLRIWMMIFAGLIALARQDPETPIWKNHAVLDSNGHYHVFWDWNTDNITIEVVVETKGYVEFGFSAQDATKGTDFFVGWVKDSQVFFQDRYVLENAEPVIDESQDYDLLAGYENDTHTVLRFRRKLDTCDEQDIAITESTMHFIFAWNDEEPVNQTDVSLQYHGPQNRGSRKVKVFNAKYDNVNFTDDVYTWDLEMKNFTIPPKELTQACGYFTFPAFSTKRHRVGDEVVIQTGHENLLHHAVLYECADESSKFPANIDYISPTDTTCNPYCTFYKVVIWGVGRDKINFLPPHTGIRFGKVGKETKFMLHVHYNNPGLIRGVVDQFALRVYLTENLRIHETDTLELGTTFGLSAIIPPKHKNFKFVTTIPAGYTNQYFPTDGINIVSVQLHGHTTLTKGILRHFRNGVQLPYILEENYDLSFQDPTDLLREVNILPGDLLVLECEYDTTNGTEVTLMGNAATDEMCITSIIYYPAMDMILCERNGPIEGLAALFGHQYKEHEITSPSLRFIDEVYDATFKKKLLDLNATLSDDAVATLQQIQEGYGGTTGYCLLKNQTFVPYNTSQIPSSAMDFYQQPQKRGNCNVSIAL